MSCSSHVVFTGAELFETLSQDEETLLAQKDQEEQCTQIVTCVLLEWCFEKNGCNIL